MRITDTISQPYGAASAYGRAAGARAVPPVREAQERAPAPGVTDDAPLEGEVLRSRTERDHRDYGAGAATPQGYAAREAIAHYAHIAYAHSAEPAYIDTYV